MIVRDLTGGKYYHTDLEVTLNDGRTVWIELSSSDSKPSHLEVQGWGGYDQWRDNCCDGHYERDATRAVADLIIEALDG